MLVYDRATLPLLLFEPKPDHTWSSKTKDVEYLVHLKNTTLSRNEPFELDFRVVPQSSHVKVKSVKIKIKEYQLIRIDTSLKREDSTYVYSHELKEAFVGEFWKQKTVSVVFLATQAVVGRQSLNLLFWNYLGISYRSLSPTAWIQKRYASPSQSQCGVERLGVL